MKTQNLIRRSLFLLLIMLPASLLLSCSKEDEDKSTPPVVTTSSVSQITTMTAVGGGTVTSEGGSAVVARGVCWGTTVNPTLSGASSTDGSTGTGSFTASIHGLTSGAVYHIRAYATNSEGTSYGEDKTFVSASESFTTVTLAPDILDTANVRLVGSVYPNNSSVAVTFEYGLTESYGNSITALESPVSGNTDVMVTAEIGGLLPGVIYHYRVRSEYMLGGIEYGHDEAFSPNGSAPEVSISDASNVKSVSAKLSGLVNANHLYTIVSFEYGTTTDYGLIASAEPETVTGNTGVIVSADIEGLSVFETYHFRIRAENSRGITFSNDMTFTTHYVLGESYFGGIIFYLDGSGEHGLVCAAEDQSTGIIWYNGNYVLTNATATNVGAGAANTATIVAIQGAGEYAAKLCYELNLNEYSDWFLPSKDELNLMYDYLTHGDYGYCVYWSSSEGDLYTAWKLGVQTGGSDSNYYDKYGYYPVRAARAF